MCGCVLGLLHPFVPANLDAREPSRLCNQAANCRTRQSALPSRCIKDESPSFCLRHFGQQIGKLRSHWNIRDGVVLLRLGRVPGDDRDFAFAKHGYDICICLPTEGHQLRHPKSAEEQPVHDSLKLTHAWGTLLALLNAVHRLRPTLKLFQCNGSSLRLFAKTSSGVRRRRTNWYIAHQPDTLRPMKRCYKVGQVLFDRCLCQLSISQAFCVLR